VVEIDINTNKVGSYIKDMIKSGIYNFRMKEVNKCPNCGNTHYIKHGYFKGIQRYRCKECGKTFSLVTNSIWSYSKKEPNKWIKFIELMLEKRTLKYCSRKLGISINTAFYWRHKVLHAMTFSKIPNLLMGNIHMTKISTKENFKGNKHIDTDVREKIFIVSAKGREDSILCLPICKKRWDFNKFNEKVYKRFHKNSTIIPYVDRYICIIAEKHNKKLGFSKKINNVNLDKFIGGFNLIFKSWFSSFYGVATKYLKEYFCWLIIYNLKRKISNISFFKELLQGEFFEKIKSIGA